jgi:hypothetical protein
LEQEQGADQREQGQPQVTSQYSSVAAPQLLRQQQLRRAIANGHAIAIADGITDISLGLGSLTAYARNKLASWQATDHPLVGPTYAEVQSLLE